MMNEHKRRENERKFSTWEELPGGGRRYFYEVQGRYGWKARYMKISREEVAQKLIDYLHHRITLAKLVLSHRE